MKILFFVITNLLAIVLAIGGIFLAYHDKEGWGWCLFLALIIYENTPKKMWKYYTKSEKSANSQN